MKFRVLAGLYGLLVGALWSAAIIGMIEPKPYVPSLTCYRIEGPSTTQPQFLVTYGSFCTPAQTRTD